MNSKESPGRYNPLELTPKERRAIDKLKKKTFYGTSSEIFQKVSLCLDREFHHQLVPSEKEMTISSPAIALKKINNIYVNIDLLPKPLWESNIEHEAAELYFSEHQERALEIVQTLGLEQVMHYDTYSPTLEHYAALYFELKRAQELGVLHWERAHTATHVGDACMCQDAKRAAIEDQERYAQVIAGCIFQLVGRDIIIDYLEKHLQEPRT